MSDAQTFNTGLRQRRMSPAREEDQGLNVTGFIWLEDIVEKLWRKHRVEQREVAEVFGGVPHFRLVEKGHRAGENVYAALGQTDGGRYLPSSSSSTGRTGVP